MEGLPAARYPVPKTGGPSRSWGFESLSFRLSGTSMVPHSGVVEQERRAAVTREIAGSSPAAGAFTRPRGRRE